MGIKAPCALECHGENLSCESRVIVGKAGRANKNKSARVQEVEQRTRRIRESIMAVKLNRIAFDFAKELIVAGRFVFDERDAWSEHRPSAQTENEFLAAHGFRGYAKWYLGINEEKHKNTKGRHEFPYGDFENVHRCGVLTAESRAAQYKHFDIENAAAHLHGMIDAKHSEPGSASAGKHRQAHARRSRSA
jgi:hypothetical protein